MPTAALGPILGERRGLPEPGPSRGRELLLQPLVLPLQPIVRTLQPIILTSQLIVLTSQLIMLTLHLIPFPGRARRDLLQPRDLFVVVALPFGPLVVDGMRAFIGHARFMADSRQKYKYKIVISTDSPATGAGRDRMLPRRDELTLVNLRSDLRDHLRWPTRTRTSTGRYGTLQQVSYLLLIFVLVPLLILTGLAQSPSLTAAMPVLLDLFGGRQSARSLHMIGTVVFVLFVVVHVVEVMAAGVLNRVRSMITGKYLLSKEGK